MSSVTQTVARAAAPAAAKAKKSPRRSRPKMTPEQKQQWFAAIAQLKDQDPDMFAAIEPGLVKVSKPAAPKRRSVPSKLVNGLLKRIHSAIEARGQVLAYNGDLTDEQKGDIALALARLETADRCVEAYQLKQDNLRAAKEAKEQAAALAKQAAEQAAQQAAEQAREMETDEDDDDADPDLTTSSDTDSEDEHDLFAAYRTH